MAIAALPALTGCQGCGKRADSHAGIVAGAAERDITPPIGIKRYHRRQVVFESTGVHDPLFARCLYLEDTQGSSVAVISLDLIHITFEACDQLREQILQHTGIANSLFAPSHVHSAVPLGPGTRTPSELEAEWSSRTRDAILEMVKEAKERVQPVSLRMGRAPAQVGFNRRLIDEETGHVYMGVNRAGPVVPWVNVLVAESETGKPFAVLFEHAAHPVIVPRTSKLTSADFPGAAAQRIREELGQDVIALFGQGCGGNINGYPLRSTHEKADSQGRKLGEAALEAIKQSTPIQSQTLSVKYAKSVLPSHPLPSEELWQEMAADSKDDESRMQQLAKIRDLMDRGAQPPSRRFDSYAVMFGQEWCLVTMPHEMFCQYELWIDENAPFDLTMAFAYTNGNEGYVAVDEAWRMGPKGGYEAASLPNWIGQVWTEHLGPPAVGSEKIIKDTIASLWSADG